MPKRNRTTEPELSAVPRLTGTALVLVAILAAVASLLPLRPPEPLGSGAAETDFSAERALEDLRELAAEPRPMGSPGHERAIRVLVDRLRELGVEPEIQEAVRIFDSGGVRLEAVRIRNVMGRLAGSDPTGTVVLMAHYDSVAHSPGAADNGAAVAALLETLRALAADGTPPRNDLLFLFSDSEEYGLSGARKFLEEHPLARDVAMVVNLEARGAGGPSILFETGPVDSAFMRRIADALEHPVANSFSREVYRRLPNDTDFTLFRERGVAGLNFAFIHDYPAYHSSLDSPGRLSPASLQHHGDSALAAARLFGNTDLTTLPPPDRGAVWFNLPGLGLVVYPLSWTWPLAILASILASVVLVVGLRRSRIRPLRLLFAAVLLLCAVAVAGLVVLVIHRLLFAGMKADGLALESGWYALWLLAGAGAALAVVSPFVRRLGELHLATAGALLWLLLVLVLTATAPAASHLALWPTVAVFAFLLFQPGRDGRAEGLPPVALVALLVAVAVTLLVQVAPLSLISVALIADPSLSAVVSAVLAGLLAVLLAGPLWVVLRRRWVLPASLGAAALALLVVVVAASGYDDRRPRPDRLFYLLDATDDTALWATATPPPEPWMEPYLQGAEIRTLEDVFVMTMEVLAAPAPVADLEPPELSVVAVEEGTDGARRWTLESRSPEGAALQRLELRSTEPIRLISLLGKPVDGLSEAAPEIDLRITAPPREGSRLVLELPPGASLEGVVVDRLYRLPAFDGEEVRRPEGTRPAAGALTDLSLILRRFELDGTVETAAKGEPEDSQAGGTGAPPVPRRSEAPRHQ